MKYCTAFAVFFFCYCNICLSQLPTLDGQHYADSLAAILKTNVSDSMKAEVNYYLVDYWTALDSAKTRYYLEQGRRLSGNNPILVAGYFFGIGQLYRSSDIEQSITAFRQADSVLARVDTKPAYRVRSRAWRNISAQMQRKDSIDKAIAILLEKVIPFSEKGGDIQGAARTYSDIAMFFTNSGQFDKADIYYKKSLAVFRSIQVNESYHLANLYLNFAKNDMERKDFTTGKQHLDSLYNLLSAHPASAEYWPHYYRLEGIYYRSLKDYPKATASIEKGISMADKLKDDYTKQGLLYQQYNIYSDQQLYGKAKDILLYIQEHPAKPVLIEGKVRLALAFSEVYEHLNMIPEAYKWRKQYDLLNDSMNEEALREKMHELESRYQKAENDKRILGLEADKQQAQLRIKNQQMINWLLGAVVAFLLIVAALVWRNYRNARKMSIQEKNLLLNKALLQGQEEERERLARDLHDGLGSMLSGVEMHLAQVSSGAEVAAVGRQLNTSLQELRRIARNMSPATLHKVGLEAALRELAESFVSPECTVSFQAFDLREDIPPATQTMIYRIVQELLANAARHGQPAHIALQCAQNGDTVLLTVEDNGKGFDGTTDSAGMGLANIRKRVEYLQGTIDITSTLGKGTSFDVEVKVR
ncbi:MAG TPA: sensor histidine kinase [Chitinophaga sp.]|uniref:tetratricopeptide repeat-containing sensor histidine kinase n=1 Tax=Chitinophaga sp. TaxID=1869181 RepID=UPI002C275047|nr:sensor histidine kinase [Chitinophaga sp.]HVI48986.1 sensor histidine kinase [Chitinophaga sp.]